MAAAVLAGLTAWTSLQPSALAAPDARDGPGDGAVDVEVATLNWPPYTARKLPRGGAVTAVVRAAFAQQDLDVAVRFWPWKRAIAKAKAVDNAVVAYFPGYHCHHDPKSEFVRSQPLGASPLGFAEHRQAQHSWNDLDDLRGKRIGTVVGYANTQEFDRRVARGELRVIPSSSDATNLRRLLDRRIDYAVVDKFVLAYLKKTHPELRGRAHEILFDARPLENKSLYLCFRDDDRGNRLRRIFDRGLNKLDPQGMLDRYVERMVKG